MKKVDQDITLLNKDFIGNKNLKTNSVKTTNINILLNRVRLDKKRDFKKKIIFLSVLISLISALSIFVLI